ncbi:MAG: Rab family GTPase [Candidatus Kariarchaeaceae archaeon]|jgi:small GTP-binding protein
MSDNKAAGQRIVAKLVLCGDWGVGKTSIRRSYMGESFVQDHLSTLGADFAVNRVSVTEDIVLELQIWDLAGQPGFENLRQRFFKGAAAAMMVFDLTRPETFTNLDSWFEQLWRGSTMEGVHKQMPIALLGNKNDLDNHKVDEQEVIDYIARLRDEHGLDNCYVSYFSTSAKTGVNIEQCFQEISKALYDDLREEN